MARYIKTANGKYLIRGDWSVSDLKNHFVSFQTKYPKAKLTFDEWLVYYEKGYLKVSDN
jgi:hypothetical protein